MSRRAKTVVGLMVATATLAVAGESNDTAGFASAFDVSMTAVAVDTLN